MAAYFKGRFFVGKLHCKLSESEINIYELEAMSIFPDKYKPVLKHQFLNNVKEQLDEDFV